MKIVKLDIEENSLLAGIDAVALVEKPAIETDFFAFAAEQFAETYSDYPEAAIEAAKQGIKRNEANDNKCATQVGKVRAQQLANREPVSLDTIRRMRSFLIRQKDNYELQRDRKAYDECGYISYLLWGGEAALPWAEKVLRQAGEEFAGDYKSNRGKEVFLLSCSATKLEKAAPARELYASPLFKKSLDYAERHCSSDDNIAILSAKHYLIPLNTVIKPYDITLNDMTREQRKQWANTTFIKILEQYDMQKDKFVFLAGEAYTEFLLPKFKYKVNLLEGKKIGERMQWLDKYYICFNDDEYAGDLIREAMAKIGPRGGVVESKKAPKSDTKNPTPKGKGTAKGEAGTTRGAKVDAKTEETLKKKSDEFNERYKDKLGYGANVGALKSVYQRGLGAYNTSRSPAVAAAGGAKQWAMARVNTFLYLLKEGRPQNKKYTTDYDLLPEGHPKKEQFELIVSALPNYVNEPTGKLKVNEGATYGFAAIDDQQMLVGPLMTPGKLIPRKDENDDTYYVYFTEDSIKRIAYKAMQDKIIDRVNIEHNSGENVDDVYLVETWLVEDPEKDKATKYGFKPIKGQWFGMYKVDNLDVWEGYVKPGLVKGFSVEGYFAEQVIKS